MAGVFSLLLGIIVCGILIYFNNDHVNILDQACPALNGSIFSFTAAMGNLLLVISVLYLSSGGFLPRFFVLFSRSKEAICCGHIFMGLFGQVLQWMMYFIIVGYNVKGTVLVFRSFNKNVISSVRNDKQPEAFCNPVVLNLARVVVALIYFSLIAYIIIGLMACHKLVRHLNATSESDTVQMRQISKKNKFRALPWAGFTPKSYAHQPLYRNTSDSESYEVDSSSNLSDLESLLSGDDSNTDESNSDDSNSDDSENSEEENSEEDSSENEV